jgi:hypothetical protein
MPLRSWVRKICWLLLMNLAAQLTHAEVTPFAFSHFALDNNLYARTMRDSKGFLWLNPWGIGNEIQPSIKK